MFQQQNELGPLNIKGYIKFDARLNYRAAKIAGKYNLSKQIFVDNNMGQPNSLVASPLSLKKLKSNFLLYAVI